MDFRKQRTWGPEPKYPRVQSYVRPPFHKPFIFIAGPCSVENVVQIHEAAIVAEDSGATHLRGGVFRAGTYPGNSFGWVDEGLIDAFRNAAHHCGLKTIIEVLDYSQESFDLINKYADCFQVGARQMQNYTLLRKLGATGKTIFLKRNTGSTIDEWLGAAEHLLAGGPCFPVLIERGSSTHMNHVRWDLSISSIPAVKLITDIPVICDASHGTGRRDLVAPMAKAGVAAGADGVLVEFHRCPDQSLSDKEQALSVPEFRRLGSQILSLRETIKAFNQENI